LEGVSDLAAVAGWDLESAAGFVWAVDFRVGGAAAEQKQRTTMAMGLSTFVAAIKVRDVGFSISSLLDNGWWASTTQQELSKLRFDVLVRPVDEKLNIFDDL